MTFLIQIKISSSPNNLNRFSVTNQNENFTIETNKFNPELNRFSNLEFMPVTQKFYQHLGAIHFMSPELTKYNLVHNLYDLFEKSEIGYYLELVAILTKIENLKKNISSDNIHFSPNMPGAVNFHSVMGVKYFEAKLEKFLEMKSLDEIYARKLWPYIVTDGLNIKLECDEGRRELSEEYLYKISTFFDDNIISSSALTQIKVDILKDTLKSNTMTSILREEIRAELTELESIASK